MIDDTVKLARVIIAVAVIEALGVAMLVHQFREDLAASEKRVLVEVTKQNLQAFCMEAKMEQGFTRNMSIAHCYPEEESE